MKSGIVTDINIHDSTIIVKRKIRIILILFSQDGSNSYKSITRIILLLHS